MKICVQTSPLCDRFGIDEGFRMIHEAGFDGVDFNIDHTLSYMDIAEGRHKPVFDAPDDDALIELIRPYKEAADRYGVCFHQMHAPFPSCVKDEERSQYALEAIRRCIRVCRYLDCHICIVHPFFLGYDDALDPETEYALNMSRYSYLAQDAIASDVTICLENMFTVHNGKIYGACCSDMQEANRYIDALNEQAGRRVFGFCLDTGHALLVGRDIYASIMALGDRLTALHIHDNNGIMDQHLFPYMGVLDWNRFTKGLHDAGYKGALSFETFNTHNVIDDELAPDALKFLGATGRMFARRIEK